MRNERIGEAPAQALRCAGDRAFLLTPRPDRVAALATDLTRTRVAGVIDIVAAATTVLVTLDSTVSAAQLREELEQLVIRHNRTDPGDVSRGTSPEVAEPIRIPVHYTGPDLDDVARMLDRTPEAVVAAHTGTVWHCDFVGFAPGFGYLRSSDAELHVARRASARTRIPAGAVALAGGYSAVYPRESPGGWQLIGHTELPVWDIERDPPALIRAGSRVQFVDVRDRR